MNNIEHDYLKLLHDILNNGVKKQDRTGTGTISTFGRQIRHDMRLGFPLLTTKKMPFKTMVTELLWFLRGDTNIKFLVDNNCHIWDGDAYKNYCNWYNQQEGFIQPPKHNIEFFIERIKTDNEFAREWGELGPIYGHQWRDWGSRYETNRILGTRTKRKPGIDQIQKLIQDIKTNPNSRRLMVNAWNVGELNQMILPPCHYGFQIYTRELNVKERVAEYEKLGYVKNIDPLDWAPKRAISLMWNQRSVDTPLGLPFNIASYGLLLEIIATATNMVPDELIGNLGDCHIYSNQIDGVKEQLTRQPLTLPKLTINTEFWPTETGEAGLGAIDAAAVFDGFSDDAYCKCFFEDLQLENYESHPAIKFPLSN